MNRRRFITQSSLLTAAALSTNLSACRSQLSEAAALATQESPVAGPLFFNISLAQWSFHKSLWSGEMKHLDFAATAKDLGIGAIEYVNQFFSDKAEDSSYLNQMNQRAKDHGIEQLLIMIDAEGSLASRKEAARLKAVENHYKWINAAKYLGCHSIRVNAFGKGKAEDVRARVVDSLGRLTEYAQKEQINILIENHGGYSSNAAWLAEVMKQVAKPNCGTLPDFGNFTLSFFPYRKYDRYQGLQELMPFAKGVSAKSHDFDEHGEEVDTDFKRVLAIVKKAGYSGYIGIEYEGYRLSERAGVLATKKLLERAGQV